MNNLYAAHNQWSLAMTDPARVLLHDQSHYDLEVGSERPAKGNRLALALVFAGAGATLASAAFLAWVTVGFVLQLL